mgnify:CR=1 FL=1
MDDKLILSGNNTLMQSFTKTDDILHDMREIIERTRNSAYQAVNLALIQRNWLMGYRIAEEELGGEDRAEYGAKLIKNLSETLSAEYGKGFDYSSLYKYARFYKSFPRILDSSSPKSIPLLSWTHYRVLLQVPDETARN